MMLNQVKLSVPPRVANPESSSDLQEINKQTPIPIAYSLKINLLPLIPLKLNRVPQMTSTSRKTTPWYKSQKPNPKPNVIHPHVTFPLMFLNWLKINKQTPQSPPPLPARTSPLPITSQKPNTPNLTSLYRMNTPPYHMMMKEHSRTLKKMNHNH